MRFRFEFLTVLVAAIAGVAVALAAGTPPTPGPSAPFTVDPATGIVTFFRMPNFPPGLGGTVQVTPMQFGCVGDGVANDTACVQAAMTAAAGQVLWTGPKKYKIMSTVSFNGKLIGQHSRTTGGFIQGVTNIDMLNVSVNNTEIDGVMFDVGSVGVSTSGRAINASFATSNINIHDNYFFKPFICADIGLGVNQAFVHNNCDQIVTNGRGVRVGHDSTGGGTIDTQIFWNTMGGMAASTGNLALLVEDSGGIQYTNNTTGNISSAIKPGQNQFINWGFFHGEFGDNVAPDSLLIDTGHSSAKIIGLDFDQAWASSSSGGNGINILNTAGGQVSGLTFRGARTFNNHNNGFNIGAAGHVITDIAIIGSAICSNSTVGANANSGISINSVNATRGKIQGNTIGNGCYGVVGGTQGAGFANLAAANDWNISGNDFTTSTGSGGAIVSSGYGARVRITDNLGYNRFVIGAITVTASPMTYTAAQSPESVYIKGGTVSNVSVGGQSACNVTNCHLFLGPNEAAVITYSVAPTMVKSVH